MYDPVRMAGAREVDGLGIVFNWRMHVEQIEKGRAWEDGKGSAEGKTEEGCYLPIC